MKVVSADFATQPAAEMLQALGKVLVRAAQVEHLLRLLIKDLTKSTYHDGMSRTQYRSSLSALERKLLALLQDKKYPRVQALTSAEQAELAQIMAGIKTCSTLRNALFHTCWAANFQGAVQPVFDDFHTCCAQLMTQIEAFRQPRYHDQDSYITYQPW